MTTETPPTWAIERALGLAGEKSWTAGFILNTCNDYTRAILAHAATLAKHEQPPVNPVALVLADYYEGMECRSTALNIQANAGQWDRNVTALHTALEKHGMLK